LSIDYLYEDCKKKIDEWQDQMHAEINVRHAEMLQQLTTLHNELTEEVKEFKIKKIDSFAHDIAEPLTYMLTKQKQVHPERLKAVKIQLESLESKIENIKKSNLIHMNYDAVKINEEINFTREHPCDEMIGISNNCQLLKLEALTQKCTHKFPLKSTGIALAASPYHILASSVVSTLILFDVNSQLRSINTIDNDPYDICWSDTMKVFFIVDAQFQTYDPLSNKLNAIDLGNCTSEYPIESVTSCDYDMFLLRADETRTIARYSLPSFTLKKEWSDDKYLDKDNDKIARCIRVNNNGVLGMTIKQNDLHWRIDLFNMQMQRLSRGVPFTNVGEDGAWQCTFSPMTNNEWLVMNNSSKPQMLSLFDKEGKLKKQVKKDGNNVVFMGTEFLVLRDDNGLYLYKLQL
jgi:hypothetical protein